MTENELTVAATTPGNSAEMRRWIGSIACALLLHVGMAALLLLDFAPASVAPAAAPLAAMTVELAPMPTAPERPPSQMPPGPDQVEQRRQLRPQPEPPRFDPPPVSRTEPPPDALASRQAKPPEPEQTLAPAERTTAAASSEAPASEILQAPVEATSSDQATGVVHTWQSRLLAHLERFKRYPRAAQLRRQEDVVYLRFKMNRSGKVLEWAVWRSRGYALLDTEVDALIQRASPLPPPPDEIGGDPVEMVIPVEFFLNRRLAQGGAG